MGKITMKKFIFMLLILIGCNSNSKLGDTSIINSNLNRDTEYQSVIPGDIPEPFIVGGDEVYPGCPDCKYPFMVSIQTNSGFHFCGGSLVREEWVITAAHCVDGENINSIKLKIGLHNINGTSGSVTRYPSQIIIHPDYQSWDIDNDYALIRLSQPVTSFEPIQLITDDIHDNEPYMATVMGWGAIYYGGPSSNVLLEVDVPMNDGCGGYWDNQITDNMICAGDLNGGEDSCQGDSGGPLIITNSNGEYELIGSVSWGYECAEANYPGVYAKIYQKLDWFFMYIGEPITEFIPELYGDIDFNGNINVVDVVLIVGFILNTQDPTPNQFISADINQDDILNILDAIQVVSIILDETFNNSIEWLEENFPELETRNKLQMINNSSQRTAFIGEK